MMKKIFLLVVSILYLPVMADTNQVVQMNTDACKRMKSRLNQRRFRLRYFVKTH